MSSSAVEALDGEVIDHRFKGFAPSTHGRNVVDLCTAGTNIFDGSFVAPIMILKEEALQNNVSTMARFCLDHNALIAPHGKTSMSPWLMQQQIEEGAWAISVATPSQVVVCRKFGFNRIILANQLVDETFTSWICAELDSDPEFDFYCHVDSVAGAQALSRAHAKSALSRPLRTMVEIGHSGGRAGCRSTDEATTVARAIAADSALELVGLAGYEGGIGHDRTPEVIALLGGYLQLVRVTAEAIDQYVAPEAEYFLVAIGGSIFFPEAIESMAAPSHIGRPIRSIIRSGAYCTHDSGLYERSSPFPNSGGPSKYRLLPAIEVWGEVISRPERNLALLSMGRRDVSFDEGLPTPQRLYRRRNRLWLDAASSTIVTLNDHHAFVNIPSDIDIEVGDWMQCGISHPCTALDKWGLIPIVDEEYNVKRCIRTFF